MFTGIITRLGVRAVIACILSLLVASVLWYGYSGHTAAKAAQARVQSLETALAAQTKARTADAAALRIAGATKSKVIVKKENTDANLKKAGAQESDWAGAVVPSSVLDAIGL